MRRVAVVCAVIVAVSQLPGSRVEGQDKAKTVSAWAKQLHHEDVAKRTEAAKALEALGPKAKAAVPDLKIALKERAWELFATQGRNANPNFTPVKPTINSGTPRQPTKDEIIAELRRELAQSKRELDELEKEHMRIATDVCLQALVNALVAIDKRALKTMIPKVTKTSSQIGRTIGNK